MPFTLSHPAAVSLLWPVARRARLPLAALATGAMSPDFEFLLRLQPLARWSHSPAGVFTFCLPASLVVLAAWELVARAPTRHLLGFRDAARPAAPRRGWWARAAVGVVLGAATHLAWDGVTHDGYWGVRLVPALRAPALFVGGGGVPWFNVLQHMSTVGGGLVVLGWLAREWRDAGAPAVLARSPWRWLVLVTLAGVALGAGLWNGARWSAEAGYWAAQLWLGRVAVAAMLGLALALLAFSVAHQLLRRPVDLPAA
jgi:hypothetical protein